MRVASSPESLRSGRGNPLEFPVLFGAYPLERFAAPNDAPVEEHLLLCEECGDRLAAWDEYVRAMRAAIITGP